MKMKFIISGALFISVLFKTLAQDTTTFLSLKQACQLGIGKNVNVQNAWLEQQKTGFQLKEAQSKLYPQIEAYSSFNYYYAIPKMVLPGEIFGQTGMIPVQIGTKYDWSNGFKATQVLYNQSYFASLKLAHRLVSLSEIGLEKQKEEIVYQVTQVYYLCQTTQNQLIQLNITMRNTDRLCAIAKLQSENGIIRKVDYARVTVNKNNLQTQIDNLLQLYQQQLGLLKYLIGIQLSSKVALVDSMQFTPASIFTEYPNFYKRTGVKLLDEQIEITTLSRKVSKSSYFPVLTGFGQYYYEGQRDEFDFFKGKDRFFNVGFVGFSLTVPIFDGFEKYTKIRQKNIELLQLQNTRKNTLDYFNKEFSDAHGQYNNSMIVLRRQEENIKIAKETYDISFQGYQQQIVSLSDLLMAEGNLTDARLSYYIALLQLNNAALDVKKTKGELLNF